MTRELLDVNAALEIVLSDLVPLEPETIPLIEAEGRYTAEAAVSTDDLPGFDNSVMDGFAIRSGDTAGVTGDSPAELEVIGESRAGSPFQGEQAPGQAVGVSTGAMLPSGADAVLQKERVDLGNGRIRISEQVEPGRDIRWKGEITQAGAEILPAGVKLGAVELGALASIGQGEVSIYRRPRVSLLTSGDELVEPGDPLGPGQIWNSNRFALTSLINESGAELVSSGIVSDGRAATVAALERSLDADLTVVCGGVSVGEHDHVRPALSDLGVEQQFWGLALKPGRPTWFGRQNGSRVLGLPGNPVSALVVFRLLAMPLLRGLAGGPHPGPRPTARLTSPVDRQPRRLFAVPCRPAEGGDPDALVPMPQLGSHDFLSLLGATRLALIEPGSGRAEVGDIVETLSLSGA